MLSEFEKQIVRALCECDMNMERVSRVLFCHRQTIYYHMGRIYKKTGLDPKKFWDLVELEKRL